MFTSSNVSLHIARASLRTETHNDVTTTVFAVGLALEPLTPGLAKQLGVDVAEHCFTRTGKIREEMTALQCRVRVKPQKVTIRMAEDSPEASAILRGVRFKTLTVTKRGEKVQGETVAKKQRKVAPQKETLRLTLSCLIDPAEREAREFICARYGDTMMFSFEEETPGLPFGHTDPVDDGEGDGEGDGQASLDLKAPTPDPEAGDVLDDQKQLDARAGKKRAGPKLVKAKPDADEQVH